MKSVLEQTYNYIEIILIDDGSTDNSYEIASGYLSDNIYLLHQENAGASVARNTGLKTSKGTFIQFLDAGDFISKDKIERQVAVLAIHPNKVAVCGYKLFQSHQQLTNDIYLDQSHFIFSSDDPQEFLINLWGGFGKMNFIQTNSWLIPKGLLDHSGMWREYRCPDDDGEFFTRVLLASTGIIYIPNVYNFYHNTPSGLNQLSKSKGYHYLKNSLLTIDLKHSYLLKKGNHPNLNKAIASQYYRYAVDVYPSHRILSAIAYKRYKNLQGQPPKIIIGGKIIHTIKILFGWKIARMIRAYISGS
jgi:glycosyltransferase involved in cell wall biosynthesis